MACIKDTSFLDLEPAPTWERVLSPSAKFIIHAALVGVFQVDPTFMNPRKESSHVRRYGRYVLEHPRQILASANKISHERRVWHVFTGAACSLTRQSAAPTTLYSSNGTALREQTKHRSLVGPPGSFAAACGTRRVL